MEKSKKTALKVAAIQALEYQIRPLDYTSEGGDALQSWEVMLLEEIYEVYKKSRRWANSDELKRVSYKLMVCILVNCPHEYFQTHIDSFIVKDLCIAFPVNAQQQQPFGRQGTLSRTPAASYAFRPYVYECVLQLLRGRFYPDSKEHARQRIAGTFSLSASYMTMTRPRGEETSDVINRRLNLIADLLFFKRSRTFGADNLDVCADITVQVGVHK